VVVMKTWDVRVCGCEAEKIKAEFEGKDRIGELLWLGEERTKGGYRGRKSNV